MELVRVTLGLLDVVDQGPLIAPLRGPPGISPQANSYNTLTLSDGRRLDYLSIGDHRGRAFWWLGRLFPTQEWCPRPPHHSYV